VDRYQELLVIAAIAHVCGSHLLGLLAFSGGILTSYAKARTAMEMPVDNDGWPDLFERLERMVFLCAMLLFDGIAAALGKDLSWTLPSGLALYAVLAHLTAAQRTLRALKLISRHDGSGSPS
jgi:hypothetical protein